MIASIVPALREIYGGMLGSNDLQVHSLAHDLSNCIIFIEAEEEKREKAAVKAIQQRYRSYGERYNWRKGEWEPIEEEVTRIPMKESHPTPESDETLEAEVDFLKDLVADLRHENLRLQAELDTREGP